MITVRKGFNDGADNKVINLDYYQNTFVKSSDHPQQKGAKFVKFDWLDLASVDLSSKNFANYNIRAEGTSRERVDEFRNEFSNNGWDCTKYPPIVDTSFEVRDGRGRIAAAIENGERFVPCAVYTYSDNSVATTAANGIKANLHQPQSRPKPADFKSAAIAAIEAGDIKGTKSSIEEYLINECGIEKMWSLKTSHPSRIVNDVLRERLKGSRSVVIKDTKTWRTWAKERFQDPDIVVLKAGNGRMPAQAWCNHVLSRVEAGKSSPKFVFYTENPSPKEAQKEMLHLQRRLDDYYITQYSAVNRDFFNNSMKDPNTKQERESILKKKRFSVLGAIPQFAEFHDIDGNEIIPLDKYMG